ncbi:melanotransferrin-like [Octopus vulgaris]|uniref:Melanotransferrin-like n=1 Tax=Octopus vulgaris TaxID=6645 RepID=A0AA36BKW1_OCTVU|nr:melanotransferrin-like [Octopus vulgaris]
MIWSTVSFRFALILSILSWASAVEFSMCEIGKGNECDNLKKDLSGHTLKCEKAANIYRCMQMVKNGEVDVVGVSDTDLYPAGKFLNLKPFLREVLDNDQTYRYKAVFLIKDGSSITNLDSLKDKKSCHTGAGKTTGWTVPVSNLQKLQKIKIKTCYDTVANVADFFAESCAPGAMSPKFNPFTTNRPAVCGLCTDCSTTSSFAGYNGALKCLLDDKGGDIAFVSHRELGKEGSLSLLCPDGSVKNQSEYESCNWATRPSDVFVTSPEMENGKLTEITKALKDNADKIKKHLDTFKDSKNFKETSENYKTIMGDGFFNTFEYYHTCKDDLRWCTVSDEEMKKCSDLKLAFAAKRATNKLKCVKGTDARDCIRKVTDKKADFVVLDGGIIVDAKNDDKCKITPGISETHITEKNAQEASYYAVAVVKKDSKLKFPHLKGAKSCHTGYGKTSGWKVPVGLLIEKNEIKNDNIAKNVGAYFSKSCVPGALDAKNNPNHGNPASLCALCPNDGKECSASKKNKYYGYTGAFRCLAEDTGEVAFVKHTTVLESTDGKGKEEWEKDLKSEDYELLCSDGSRESVQNWLTCHLAKVPAHAMVFNDDQVAKRMYSVFSYLDLGSSETKDLLFSSSDADYTSNKFIYKTKIAEYE